MGCSHKNLTYNWTLLDCLIYLHVSVVMGWCVSLSKITFMYLSRPILLKSVVRLTTGHLKFRTKSLILHWSAWLKATKLLLNPKKTLDYPWNIFYFWLIVFLWFHFISMIVSLVTPLCFIFKWLPLNVPYIFLIYHSLCTYNPIALHVECENLTTICFDFPLTSFVLLLSYILFLLQTCNIWLFFFWLKQLIIFYRD